MEKILKFFQTNPVLKIFISFGVMFLICWLFNLTEWSFLNSLIWIPGAYLILTWCSLVVLLVRIIKNERHDKKHDINGKIKK